MCGINGYYNYLHKNIANHDALVRKMNDILAHRGPDDQGTWSDPDHKIVFGHRRLSILDLSARGHQPMVGPNGNVIVFNGEIYNFRALRKELKNRDFQSESDTEVLLHLYDEMGADLLNEVNGMFAFAIWDPARRELFLARDRIGIKPLYYTTMNDIFAFSSEVKALLTLPWVRAELDEEALYDFLTFNRLAPPSTLFQGIHKVHPGYRMRVGQGGIEEYEPFWEVTYSNHDTECEDSTAGNILRELDRSVTLRMVSDVPVGAYLSGGVDSSSIVALMSKKATMPIKTYTIGFAGEPDYDERQYAERVARLFGTEHHEKIVTPKDMVNFLPRMVDIYDEPLADLTSIPLYFLSEMAKETGTSVVLTGDGADELFCGYRNWYRYKKYYPYFNAYCKLPGQVKKFLAQTYGHVRGGTVAHEMLSRAAQDQVFFWGGAGGIKESSKNWILSDDFAKRMEKKSSYEQIERFRMQYCSLPMNGRKREEIDWMCWLGLKYIVPNYYMYRADHMGMAHSVELRVPFLDHEFVNYALSIRPALKLKAKQQKYILKKALEDILPREILYREKRGFSVPILEWSEQIMLGYLETKGQAFCKETGIFDFSVLKDWISGARTGRRVRAFELFNIYFLINWFNRWLL